MSVEILQGDVREILPTLPADHFDCVVTSPPYWGLRDYGVAGQIGLEPELSGYLDTMVDVCRELQRVLKPEGTFWLNIGDSYATPPGSSGSQGKHGARGSRSFTAAGSSKKGVPSGLKAKDLCMVPNRLAIRLQEAGWYVRSEIIWHKPNPMPESVRDRPTSAHEKVWMLTKSERYWYDQNAVRKPLAASSVARLGQDIDGQAGSDRANGANAHNVWTVATVPYKDAHFAVMAPELAERCIKAGCPVGGSVLDPFGGAGTTGLVADRLQRHATLIELNPEYVALARGRISNDAPLLALAN